MDGEIRLRRSRKRPEASRKASDFGWGTIEQHAVSEFEAWKEANSHMANARAQARRPPAGRATSHWSALLCHGPLSLKSGTPKLPAAHRLNTGLVTILGADD